jgi:hypothetical protein
VKVDKMSYALDTISKMIAGTARNGRAIARSMIRWVAVKRF